jgi:uncharacterized C2H2 Zn-finger protein
MPKGIYVRVRRAKERIMSGAGYWMIPAPPDYKGKIYSTGLIYEHRYVLEKKIGRYLVSGESSHHINGNKLDNRPENLELIKTLAHIGFHVRQRGRKTIVLKCPSCGTVFEKNKNNTHLQKSGSFTVCSASCKGNFCRRIQLEGYTEDIKNRIANNVIKEYRKFLPL